MSMCPPFTTFAIRIAHFHLSEEPQKLEVRPGGLMRKKGLKMVRGRGFEPLNPYGTRSPNTRPWMFLSFTYVWFDTSRAFDLASPSQR